MKLELIRRKFPDIDEDMYCLAVRAHDELRKLMVNETLTATDIDKIKDMLNILLLIRKTAPKLASIRKFRNTETDTSYENILTEE